MKKTIRHFLTLGDLSLAELQRVLKRSQDFKKNRLAWRKKKILPNHIIGLLFQKPSTRTRVSFETGILEMGGSSIYLDQYNLQIGRGESLLDTLLVMERYLSGMVIRNNDHSSLAEAAKRIRIPLINGLSDTHHPAQAVADACTVRERIKKAKPRIAYLGEGNNVTVSLIEICSRLGWPLTVASPPPYSCTPSLTQDIIWDKRHVTFTEDPEQAVRGADVIYTDTWFSMTEDVLEKKKNATKKKTLLPFQVNDRLLRSADPEYIFMHCLPAYRGQEVTAEVIDGPHSVVFDQAENRLHAQKALLEFFFSAIP